MGCGLSLCALLALSVWQDAGVRVPPQPPPVLPAVTGTAGHHHHGHHGWLCVGRGEVMPPGPGYGWGFVNNNPDGYGWVDYGTRIPLGADRTSEYFYQRKFSVPAPQAFMPTYYNPYVSRGLRFVPYVGAGGEHPAGRAPTGSAILPMYPYEEFLRSQPAPGSQPTPRFGGRVEAPPGPSGSSGLLP